jgi:DNA-binding transcriptional ArsR family regulator
MQDRALWDKEEDDMSETVLASPRKSDLLEIVKTLSDVTRKLSEITQALAAQAGESPPAVEALAESEAALAQASRHLSMLQETEVIELTPMGRDAARHLNGL